MMEHLSKKVMACGRSEQFAGQRFARLTGAKCDVVGIFPGEFRRPASTRCSLRWSLRLVGAVSLVNFAGPSFPSRHPRIGMTLPGKDRSLRGCGDGIEAQRVEGSVELLCEQSRRPALCFH